MDREDGSQEIGPQMQDVEAGLLNPGDALVIDGERLAFRSEFSRRSYQCRHLRKCDHEGVTSIDALSSEVAEGRLSAIRRIEVHPTIGKALAQGRSRFVVGTGLCVQTFEVGKGDAPRDDR